jgi:hypothetical protein
MHLNWTLTLDGVMTLIAGLIAFVAVIIQIRLSSSELKKQLDADREVRKGEEERLKRAVTTAILLEIESVYLLLIEQLRGATFADQPLPTSFPVFEGNAGQLGLLHQETVAAVVRFCGSVGRHFLTSQALVAHWKQAGEEARSASSGDVRLLAPTYIRNKYDQHVEAAIQPLESIADEACSNLCEASKVLREGVRIPFPGAIKAQ